MPDRAIAVTKMTKTDDFMYAAARLHQWYVKHPVRDVPVGKLIKDCQTFARLFQTDPKEILNCVTDHGWIVAQGSDSYLVSRNV